MVDALASPGKYPHMSAAIRHRHIFEGRNKKVYIVQNASYFNVVFLKLFKKMNIIKIVRKIINKQ